MVGETLLASFGFKFRSVVNLLVSVYAVAVTFSFWDYGSSGIENVASVFGLLGLNSVASGIASSYITIRDFTGVAHDFLAFLVGAWLVLSCIFFAQTYEEELPKMHNIAPNSVFGVTAFFGLCVDLFSPGNPWNLALAPIIASVAWGSYNAVKISSCTHKVPNALAVSFVIALGLLSVPLYLVLSFPLWFAQGSSLGSDSDENEHE